MMDVSQAVHVLEGATVGEFDSPRSECSFSVVWIYNQPDLREPQ